MWPVPSTFPIRKTASVAFFLSWLFVISWNGIGVEAAACYVAECRDPHRDAKLALTTEGVYGLFIYAGTAIVFVAVLGATLTTSDPLTLYSSFADHIFGSAHWVKYVIGIPLIGALLLDRRRSWQSGVTGGCVLREYGISWCR